MATLLQKLQALSGKRVFLGHQSVGANFLYGNPDAVDFATYGLQGFNPIFEANPGGGVTLAIGGNEPTDAQITAWQPGQWCEFLIGGENGNGNIPLKVDNFHSFMDRCAALGRTPDYAGFKFCFADFGETFPESDWTYYIGVMDALEAAYPGRIIYWTVALTPHPDANEGAGDIVRWEWAKRIRERYGYTGRVFDFSARERLDSLNRLMNVANIPGMAWEWADNWNPAWDNVNPQYPAGGLGSHVNNNFANRIALQYIDFLYGLAAIPTMTTASRTTGVAPLAVFFDAVDEAGATSPHLTFDWTSGVTQPSDMEGSNYSWNFGDLSSGTWATTGALKNTATGYTAAHVFETSGVYDVLLDVTDATTGVVSTYRQSIVVSDFSGTSRYIAATAQGSGDGTSPANAWGASSLGTAMAWVTAGTNRALYFRRGDSFTISSTYSLTAAGPNIIGAYGTPSGEEGKSNRPVLNVASSARYAFRVANGNDWRIMDLDAVGPWSGGPDTFFFGPFSNIGDSEARMSNVMLLRVKMRNWYYCAVFWTYWTLLMGNPSDAIFFVDIDIVSPYTFGMYIGGRRLVLLGSNVSDKDDPGGGHNIRIWQAHKAVISNNTVLRNAAQRHLIKMHAPEINTWPSLAESKWITVTDNIFDHGTGCQWALSMGSQSDTQDEAAYVYRFVIERNLWLRSTGTMSSLANIEFDSGSQVVIRNNVTIHTGMADSVFVMAFNRNDFVPNPTDVRIYNNTLYRGTAASDVPSGIVSLDSTCQNIRIRNNLFGTSSTNLLSIVSGTPLGGWGANGNAQDHNLITTTPGFTNAAGGDFTLTVGSPAVDTGVTLADVREDFARTPRTGTYEIGAYVYGPAAPEAPSIRDSARVSDLTRAGIAPGVSGYTLNSARVRDVEAVQLSMSSTARRTLAFEPGPHKIRIESVSGVDFTLHPVPVTLVTADELADVAATRDVVEFALDSSVGKFATDRVAARDVAALGYAAAYGFALPQNALAQDAEVVSVATGAAFGRTETDSCPASDALDVAISIAQAASDAANAADEASAGVLRAVSQSDSAIALDALDLNLMRAGQLRDSVHASDAIGVLIGAEASAREALDSAWAADVVGVGTQVSTEQRVFFWNGSNWV